jgi:hypothetical protein
MTGSDARPASHPAFVRYPAQAAFGRTLPKSKLYEQPRRHAAEEPVRAAGGADRLAVQAGPETINLPARPAVPEIQVFAIQLKTPELSDDVLRAIDRLQMELEALRR